MLPGKFRHSEECNSAVECQESKCGATLGKARYVELQFRAAGRVSSECTFGLKQMCLTRFVSRFNTLLGFQHWQSVREFGDGMMEERLLSEAD
jgi:hypothetical protein